MPLGVLLAAAALLRLWSSIVLVKELRIQEPVLDGRYYLDLARSLAAGNAWPPEPVFMTPLYPLLLSAAFRLSPAVAMAQAAQSVLGLAALLLLFAAARRDLGSRAAWGAAVLYLLCGPILAMESQVLTETLLLFLVALALWLWPRERQGRWGGLGFGLVCGALTLGRGVFLALPLVALWQEWLMPRSRGRSIVVGAAGRAAGAGARWSGLVWIAAGLALSLLPLAVHQTRTTGRLQVLTLNGGLNLYLGNNPWARGLYSVPPGVDLEHDITAARSASILAGRRLDLAQADRFWGDRARRFLIENPGRALWLWGRKALLYLSPHEIPQIEDVSVLRRASLPLRVAWIDFRWILPLSVLGLLVALRRPRGTGGAPKAGPALRGPGESSGRPPRIAPWIWICLIGWVATTVFFATGRYRIPFLPGFLGLAGLGVAAAWSWVGERRAPRWGMAVLPAVVALQLLLPAYPREKAASFDAYQLGIRLARLGRVEEALQAHREAARLWPESGEAWHGIGVALVRLGRLPEAAEAYRQALQRTPDSAVTRYNLGSVLGRMGDHAGALREFHGAVSLDPLDPSFRTDYAIALANNGRPDEAVRELQRVLASHPSHDPARRALESLQLAR